MLCANRGVATVAPREPSWWYAAKPTWQQRALQPAAKLYGHLVERRIARAQPYVSTLPVICVGNFTAGGTGKTPLTQHLAERLIEEGGRPCILSRGYGGQLRGPHWVNAQSDSARDVGDEPLLLAVTAPVLVSRDRAAGAHLIEASDRAFTHILMDDGLQNPSLHKSLRLAVVDGRRGFGNGAIMPAGPLRAALAFQQTLADAIILNQGFRSGQRLGPDQTDACVDAFPGPVFRAHVVPAGDTTWLQNHPLLAFAGIGAPEHFFQMLRGLDAVLSDTIPFGDHHAFTETDAADLLARARATGAQLITTEKDRARLVGTAGARGQLRQQARTVPIRMIIDVAGVAQFDALLTGLKA
jgi:tetraacyldisaccharide 4'-kinase